MKIYDVLKSKECINLFNEISDFARKSLSDYIKSINENGFDFSVKDIFDSVWGTVEFSDAEMCLLDSPILQRLRNIKQLGFANVVYCDAVCTRFSHTIGVTEMATRMCKTALKEMRIENYSKQFPDYDSFDIEQIVRFAAILHDTGHMLYSHASEIFFSFDENFPRHNEIVKAKSFFAEKTCSEVSLHELFSVMIVQSEAMFELLTIIGQKSKSFTSKKEEHIKQLQELVSCLIIGVPINKFILPFSTIINSALDADKLDYLMRDSQCTKVPIAVDVPRIICKLGIVCVDRIHTTEIWNDHTSEMVQYKLLAIKNSSKNAFYHLSNAKSILYESVYYHHKVLTAETMFRNVLREFYKEKNLNSIKFDEIMSFTDNSFDEHWQYTMGFNENDDIDNVKPEKENAISSISNFICYLKYRQLFKRVSAFSSAYLEGDHALIELFLQNIMEDSMSNKFLEFKAKLLKEYNEVCKLLDVTPFENPIFMFISSNYDPCPAIPLERGDGFCLWSEEFLKKDAMEAGARTRQNQCYLVTNCPKRIPVFLALEKVVYDYGIRQIKTEATACLKDSQNSNINKYRLELLEKDYYKDCLDILSNNFLISIDLFDNISINTILEKFHSFQGANDCKITRESVLHYLRQFLRFSIEYSELKQLFNGIFLLLKSINYLDRDIFVKNFQELINDEITTSKEKINVVFLGGLHDSGNHLIYFINDIQTKENISFQNSIIDALKTNKGSSCIYFFDDGAYSGKQVISIFQEYMGVPKDQRTTSETHVTILDRKNQELLKKKEIVILYVCFNPKSEGVIKEKLKEIELNNVKIKFKIDLSNKVFDDSSVFVDENQRKIVKKWMYEAGVQILDSEKRISDLKYKEHWDKDRIEKSALGYNDAQQITVFNSNVPTYTLTALWGEGTVNGTRWKGLFNRTKKD